MYRFLVRPKWIAFHLLVVLLVVLMVNLGFWQLRRLDERKEFNESVRSRSALPIADYASVVPPGTDPDDVEWRVVSARGTYVPEEEVLVVNRSQGGIAGRNVVTPLRLDTGGLLLVTRGFLPQTVDVPPPPSGPVDVRGVVRASEERRTGQLTEASDGELVEFQRLDIDRIAPQMPGPVEPVSIDLRESAPSQGDVLAPVPDPELAEGPHLSYAVQWFIFSLCAIAGWFFAVRRSALTASGRRKPTRSPVPVDDAPTTAAG
jgi:cytochrome oxidase assembly protein ShyY1